MVVDAVAHAYNFSWENFSVGDRALWETITRSSSGGHRLNSSPGTALEDDEILHDWAADEIERIYAEETEIDLVVYHGTPIYDLWRDGHSANDKGAELRRRNPGRVMFYAGLNPMA